MDIDRNLNYYSILGVSWDSDDKEIKTAYRNLSKIFHPDKNDSDDIDFTKIVEAYKILSDSSLRSQYDTISRFGKSYDETIELYNFEFSNENSSVDQYQKDFNRFKKKELIDILIKMNEFRQILEYDRYISCKSCDGTGMSFDDRLYVFECDLCDGIGEWNGSTCPSCKGNGESSLKKCDTCGGEKIIEIKERVKLDIGKFIDGKCKIEFKGNASSLETGKVGSLYIMINEV